MMNIPNAVSGETLTTYQKFENVLKQAVLAEELGFEQREQIERFATEVAPVLRREIPSTVWNHSPVGLTV